RDPKEAWRDPAGTAWLGSRTLAQTLGNEHIGPEHGPGTPVGLSGPRNDGKVPAPFLNMAIVDVRVSAPSFPAANRLLYPKEIQAGGVRKRRQFDGTSNNPQHRLIARVGARLELVEPGQGRPHLRRLAPAAYELLPLAIGATPIIAAPGLRR